MQKSALIPMFISSLRIAALPLFFYLYNIGNAAACLGLLAFCAATDFFDGYIARKLNIPSRLGAYYDAITDFVFMFGIFAFFYGFGFYPIWLLLVIATAFIQFIISSHYAKKTLRSRGTLPWKRPLHRGRLNLALANSDGFCFCAVRFCSVLLVLDYKPHNKLYKKSYPTILN